MTDEELARYEADGAVVIDTPFTPAELDGPRPPGTGHGQPANGSTPNRIWST